MHGIAHHADRPDSPAITLTGRCRWQGGRTQARRP